jgi:hypothetical protein
MRPLLRSALARPIDPSYVSNRFVLVAAGVAGAAWTVWKLVREGDVGAALVRGGAAAVAVFLAWAIARELDPDRPWTAGVAGVACGAVVGAGVPSLLVGAGALGATRLVAGTTGSAPRPADRIALVVLAGVVSVGDAGPAVGLAIAAALAVDALAPGRRSAHAGWAVPAAAGAAVGAAALWGTLAPSPGLPVGPEWAVVPLAAVGLLALGRPGSVAALGDVTGEPLSAVRIRLSRPIAVLAAGLTFLWAGGVGSTAGSIVWSALAAVALPGRFADD